MTNTLPAEHTNRSARYIRLAAYEQWAFDKLTKSLESVGPGAGSDAAFVKACALAMHIELTRHEWLWRLTNQRQRGPLIEQPATIFVHEADLRDIRREHARSNDAWADYLSTLDEPELDRVATFRSTEGHQHETRVEDILTHLAHHGMYHRGQIATLVRVAGGKPAMSDFILFSYQS